jgi:hypothetical protein
VLGRVKTRVVADPETAPQTGSVSVHGLRMDDELHGAGGIPLLLLCGGLCTIDLPLGQPLAGLSATRLVIGADFQGHGRTGDIDQADVFG